MKSNCTPMNNISRGIWYYWLMKHAVVEEAVTGRAKRCVWLYTTFSQVKLLSDDYFRFWSRRGLVHYPPCGQRDHVMRDEIWWSFLTAPLEGRQSRVSCSYNVQQHSGGPLLLPSKPPQTLSTTITGIRIFERLKRQWIGPRGVIAKLSNQGQCCRYLDQ